MPVSLSHATVSLTCIGMQLRQNRCPQEHPLRPCGKGSLENGDSLYIIFYSLYKLCLLHLLCIYPALLLCIYILYAYAIFLLILSVVIYMPTLSMVYSYTRPCRNSWPKNQSVVQRVLSRFPNALHFHVKRHVLYYRECN